MDQLFATRFCPILTVLCTLLFRTVMKSNTFRSILLQAQLATPCVLSRCAFSIKQKRAMPPPTTPKPPMPVPQVGALPPTPAADQPAKAKGTTFSAVPPLPVPVAQPGLVYPPMPIGPADLPLTPETHVWTFPELTNLEHHTLAQLALHWQARIATLQEAAAATGVGDGDADSAPSEAVHVPHGIAGSAAGDSTHSDDPSDTAPAVEPGAHHNPAAVFDCLLALGAVTLASGGTNNPPWMVTPGEPVLPPLGVVPPAVLIQKAMPVVVVPPKEAVPAAEVAPSKVPPQKKSYPNPTLSPILAQCPDCGAIYTIDDDDRDWHCQVPYCGVCQRDIPILTGADTMRRWCPWLCRPRRRSLPQRRSRQGRPCRSHSCPWSPARSCGQWRTRVVLQRPR